MKYEERLQNVTILGAAGKMGSGIVLLTAIEMADLKLKPENKEINYVLNALDLSKEALVGLLSYLKTQLTKQAEKKIELLKPLFSNATEDAQIIEQYVNFVLEIVNPITEIEIAYKSTIIFEVASENPDLKVKLFSQINQNNKNKPWFLTNTSSIPIHILNEKANLEGRIVGCHFYNPPAIQKLVEVIAADKTLPDLVDFTVTFAKKLRKIVVPSNDIAGFIGNGHFLRDVLYATSEVERLRKEMSLHEAIYVVNKVSQEYLVRPMGIFQLCDYVGIDVCQYILKVMDTNIANENLNSELLNSMISVGVKGGQNADGSQKDGFMQYEKGRPVSIYNYETKSYIAVSEIKEKCDTYLGSMPTALAIWKVVIASPEKDDLLNAHFNEIKYMQTEGAKMALNYGKRAVEIGKKLVSNCVAKTEQDVNTVMLTGFFHAYGPINNYF